MASKVRLPLPTPPAQKVPSIATPAATQKFSANLLRELLSATNADDVCRVMILLSTRAPDLDVNGCDDHGDSPLHLAAHHGNIMIALLLLQKKANVNVQNTSGLYTPLHRASWNGHIEMMSLLLEQKANIQAVDSDGYTPLHWAAWNGKVEAVDFLIQSKAMINPKDKYGCTPLHRACLDGHAEVQYLLLKSGADANLANDDGDTPLHIASRRNDIDSMKLLLQFFANPLITNKQGKTPRALATAEKTKNILLESERTAEHPKFSSPEPRPVIPRERENRRTASFAQEGPVPAARSLPTPLNDDLDKNRSQSLPRDFRHQTPPAVPKKPLMKSPSITASRLTVQQWSIEQVCKWLTDNNLGSYSGIFDNNEIDGHSLLLLSSDDLASLVPNKSDLSTLLNALERLK